MEFKGTKGKWVLGEQRKSYRYIDCPDGSWYEMARVVIEVSRKTSESGKANALLISKAPEMLEMLQKCRTQLVLCTLLDKSGQCSEMVEEIEQLIKEATEI
jgi:hypothetical protein